MKPHWCDSTILTISCLDVLYGDFRALSNVSMTIERGRTMAIVGANGSGKSTLVKAIAGLLKPTRGAITFNGQDVSSLPPHERVERGIAVVPEGRRIFRHLSVRENLLVAAHLKRCRNKLKESLARVYGLFPVLEERSGQMGGTLSGGEQQMLAIGRALMAAPSLILCDEISMGLSPAVVTVLNRGVREISRTGVTVMLIEQEAARGLAAAEEIHVMFKGEAVLRVPTAECDREALCKAYFGT